MKKILTVLLSLITVCAYGADNNPFTSLLGARNIYTVLSKGNYIALVFNGKSYYAKNDTLSTTSGTGNADTALTAMRWQLPAYQLKYANIIDTAKYIEYADTTASIAKRWQFNAYRLKASNDGDSSTYLQMQDSGSVWVSKGFLSGATFDTTKTGAVSNIWAGANITVAPRGKGFQIASTGGGATNSFAKSQIDTVGTVTVGTWSATSIDTAKTNAVSKLTGQIGISAIQTAKAYIIRGDTAVVLASKAYVGNLYQTKGSYLSASDSSQQRLYSNALYAAKATYLVPNDTTIGRTYSNAKYQDKGTFSTATSIRDSISTHAMYVSTWGDGYLAKKLNDSTITNGILASLAVSKADIYTIGQPLALDSSMIVAGRIFPMMIGNNEIIDSLFIISAGSGCSFTSNLYCSQTNFTATDSLLSAVWSATTANGKQSKVTSDMRSSGSLGTRIWWFKITTVTTRPDAIVVQMKGHRS